MKITTYIMGPIETNTYFLETENEVIIIDPAGKDNKVIELIGDKKPIAVLLTHGHFDHIKAVDGLYEKYHLPVYLNNGDDKLARDKYQGRDFNIYCYIACPTIEANDGHVDIGKFSFDIFHTPGHTEGSVIYKFEKNIFTGDTLFKESVGRTDLEGGNSNKLNSSLKLFHEFEDDCLIYPGHGPSSDIKHELVYNPYL